MSKSILIAIAVSFCSLASMNVQAKAVMCGKGEEMIYIDNAEGGHGPTCIKKVKKAKAPKMELPCPEDSLSYIDKSEGGPGFYCECPQDKITYIDKAEGGSGLTCVQ